MNKILAILILFGITTCALTLTQEQSFLAVVPSSVQPQPADGCGCSNVFGNCTCISTSLSCNTTFFDGTWGILPYGASVNYTSQASPLTPAQTETYLCQIDYNPPFIFPTIIVLAFIGLVLLIIIDRIRRPESLQGSLLKKAYKYGTTMNTFWPIVHLAITMGYILYLIEGQSFTFITTGTTSEYLYYILVNTNWYINNPHAINLTTNAATSQSILQVNGQNCWVQETTPGDYSYNFFPSYYGIVGFLIISLVHVGLSIFRPNAKMYNYLVNCIATGVNMTTGSWTWTVWDTCYALLPEYDPGLFQVYIYLAGTEMVGFVLVTIMLICSRGKITGCIKGIAVLMGAAGLVFKILTYFQLAVRYYPKLVLILDIFYHLDNILPFIGQKMKETHFPI